MNQPPQREERVPGRNQRKMVPGDGAPRCRKRFVVVKSSAGCVTRLMGKDHHAGSKNTSRTWRRNEFKGRGPGRDRRMPAHFQDNILEESHSISGESKAC